MRPISGGGQGVGLVGEVAEGALQFRGFGGEATGGRLCGRAKRSPWTLRVPGGEGLHFEWTFTEGGSASGERVERMYSTPGTYCETLKVTDAAGGVDYDFMAVQVVDRTHPDQPPPTIHAKYAPTFGIRPGDPVIFKVRTYGDKAGGETWDFGDGMARVSVKSDANADRYAPNGYAEARHVYAKSGHYLVSVEHVSAAGVRAVARLQVRVGTEGSILSVRVGQPVPLPNNAGDTWVSAWAKNGAVYSP